MEQDGNKKKSSVGIVIAIVVACVALAAAAITIVLIASANKGADSDEVTTSSEAKQPSNVVPTPSLSDNAGIIAASAENGNIGDHVRGKRDSKVLVVEYADPQCPGCAMVMPIMTELYEKYGDKVAFVYRHYTIAGHKNAVSAAIAIEAAGKQGYFWEMLEALFDNQVYWAYKSGSSLTLAYLELFKEVAGSKANETQFKKDLNDENLRTKVTFDKARGGEDEVMATPTVIVNGEQVDFYESTDIKKTIEAAIVAALK